MAAEFVHIVGIEPQHQAEAATERRADEALPRGGADGGEAFDVHRMSARAGPVPIMMSMRKSSRAEYKISSISGWRR